MKYGKSKVLICEVMGFVRIFWKEQHPRGLLACEQALLFGQAKRASRERASEGPRKGELATISHKFSFPPRNPGTPQSVKTVTANVPQIRKVTTACQVSLDSRGRVELFIFINRFRNSIKAMFFFLNHWYVFFFLTGTSNFNVSARIRTHYFDSRFVYFWKVVHTAV